MLGGDPLLERSVHYNNLSAASVTELNALAKMRGMEVLQELNARALQFQQQDSGTPDASLGFNFGIYLFTEEEPGGTVAPDDSATSKDNAPPKRRRRAKRA